MSPTSRLFEHPLLDREPSHLPLVRVDFLSWAGEVVSEELDLPGALDLALAYLRTERGLKAETRAKLEQQMRRLLTFADDQGVRTVGEIDETLIAAALERPRLGHEGRWVAPSDSSKKNRLWATRRFFEIMREVGVTNYDPTARLRQVVATSTPTLPLTDEEMERVRICARTRMLEDRGPAVIALAECGATHIEIAEVLPVDISIPEAQVVLGSGKDSRRTVHLTEWGIEQIIERLGQLDDWFTPLTVDRTTTGYSASSSISGAIKRVFDSAGVRRLGVTPASIRAYAGWRTYGQTGSIEATARHLGVDSLDTAARIIGLDWQGTS